MERGRTHAEGEVDLAFGGVDHREVACGRVRTHEDEEVGKMGDTGAIVGLGGALAYFVPLFKSPSQSCRPQKERERISHVRSGFDHSLPEFPSGTTPAASRTLSPTQ